MPIAERLDEAVINKVKSALDVYSQALPFAPTSSLGQDAKIISAKLYQVYTCCAESRFIEREFTSKHGGEPVLQPRSISSYDIWEMDGFNDENSYESPILETCVEQKCNDCGGTGRVDCKTCGQKGKIECPECHGERIYACHDCGGNGVNVCKACDGSGDVECQSCSGSGKKQCPTCKGRRKIDAVRTVKCPKCHGTGEIVERGTINGDVYYVCRICDGTGQIEDEYKEICPTCRGIGSLPCLKCSGTGKQKCSRCHGRGELRCSTCTGRGEIRCHTCQEQGLITCKDCSGKGYNVCPNCSGDGHYIQMYYLKQTDRTERTCEIWADADLPQERIPSKLKGYNESIVLSEKSDDIYLDEKCNPKKVCPDCKQLVAAWEKSIKMFSNKERYRFKLQRIELKRFDCCVWCVYSYMGKEFKAWIDLASGKVSEDGRGLCDECLNLVLQKDKERIEKIRETVSRQAKSHLLKAAAFRAVFIPQRAICEYVKACALSDDWRGITRKIHGLVRRIWLWMLCGFAGSFYFVWLPMFGKLNMTDFYTLGYTGLCLLNAVLLLLLFRWDFSLRLAFGVPGLLMMGGLVGWAFAPRCPLGFVPNPCYVLGAYGVLATILATVLKIRSDKRYFNAKLDTFFHITSVREALRKDKRFRPSIAMTAVWIVLLGVNFLVWHMIVGREAAQEKNCTAGERAVQACQTSSTGMASEEIVKLDD